ncbi:MAG: hypothetical protein M3421_11055 [Bacteroidota bacterium]|jgi:hypothetical protein|nr:hypothetical protein [Bacteroidota bacterium]
MRPNDFQHLAINEKARIILNNGSFVYKSEFHHLEISLYKVEENYVEIWFDPIKGKITNIDYVNDKPINPYLKHLGFNNLN